jgi:hypothetical protein
MVPSEEKKTHTHTHTHTHKQTSARFKHFTSLETGPRKNPLPPNGTVTKNFVPYSQKVNGWILEVEIVEGQS